MSLNSNNRRNLHKHCKRSFSSSPYNKKKDITIDCFTNKILKTSPLLKYDEIDGRLLFTPNQKNVNIHWGQRKLFLSELMFLNECYDLYDKNEPKYFIYAGAAGGHHLPLLSLLYPDITFLLYDPAKFAIKGADKLKIFNEYFTDETAHMLKKYKNSLFCSDIRRTTDDNEILEDMEWQRNWVRIIQPHASLLKFRVLFPENQHKNDPKNKYTYLDGTLYMQQYAPVKSTELRLLSKKKDTQYKDRIYDKFDIESTCFFFNQVIRQSYYYNKSDYKCLSHHYDTMAEVSLWKDYLTKHNIKSNNSLICKLVDLLTKCIINPTYKTIKNNFDEIMMK